MLFVLSWNICPFSKIKVKKYLLLSFLHFRWRRLHMGYLRCSEVWCIVRLWNISILLNQFYVFSGGNCDMTCEAATSCEFSCTSGDCATTICKADTCDQSCTGGGCGLECHGTTCEQSCTSGNCALQCSSEAETCQQSCTINKGGCTIEYIWCSGASPGTDLVPNVYTHL